MFDSPPPVLELRVTLTSADHARLVSFYATGLGLDLAADWTSENGRALLLELGPGTLELFDEQQASYVDGLEAGQRVSGQVRLALRVPDLQSAIHRLLSQGATLVHPPVVTPWGDYNVRLQDPDGMQVTLFQVMEPPD